MKRRLVVSLVSGAILGVICVIGGSVRAGGLAGNERYLAAMWYNRVIIGLVVGLAAELSFVPGAANRYLRGALLGLVVSLAFFLSTGFQDLVAFGAGIVYGVIIEYSAHRWG
jgi:hypothetical protein